MKYKWFYTSVAVLLLAVMAFLGLARHDAVMAAQNGTEKIEGMLLDRFNTDGTADYIARFVEQADLSAAYSMDWDARGEYVYNTLLETANLSQVNAKAILDGYGLAYQTFFSGNDLYVFSGTLVDANALAALPEVASVRATRVYQVDPSLRVSNPLMTATWAGDLIASHALTTVGASPDATIAWGVLDTKANQFWTTFGVSGEGIIVANIDTGVDYTHVALNPNYKCAGNPSDPACWLNPGVQECTGPNGGPCDSWTGIYHGTHVMGTQAGDNDPSLVNWVGMAPGSQWIACMGCPSGSCPDFDLNSCADWVLAPGGEPSNRPMVVNNSWGGGGGNPWWLSYVQAWSAAGIFPAFSAGNSGPGCGTLGSPGDYQASFASAAHDISRNIASFSSRGPSAYGHDPYTKPNISSPGVNVLSAMPGNGWQTMDGTSMASPHSAGAVALLWSCNPALIGQVDMTFQILQNNANTPPAGNCGAPPDGEGNYTYGYGYTDVLAAGVAVCGGVSTGFIEGHVYDDTGAPIEGASVNAAPAILENQVQAITDPTGYYTMTAIVGTYDVTASKLNYTPQTVPDVVVITDTAVTADFTLTYLGAWNLVSPLPQGCPDWYRYDGEFFPDTGLVYFLGGRSSSLYTDTHPDVISFDPVTQTCADTGTDMPTPVSNYTIIPLTVNGTDLLCIFGGVGTAGSPVNNFECYDPIGNTAANMGTLPGQLGQFNPGGAAVVDNIAYVFGGFRNTASPYHTSETWGWDPGTNLWTQKGNITIGRGYINVEVVDGIIYGFGGDVFDGANLNAQTIAESFDPAAGTWNDAAVADMPQATGEGRAFGFSPTSPYDQAGRIIIASGGLWPASTPEVFFYDLASDTYDYSFPDLNVSRRDAAGFFIPSDPGQMWVFGGWAGADAQPFGLPEFYSVNITTPEPEISVEPGALHSSQVPDTMVTLPITISNVGTAPLEWSIQEGLGIQSVRVVPNAAPNAHQPVILSLGSQPSNGVQSNTPAIPTDLVSLVLDDGSYENSIGLNDGTFDYQFLWFNRFTPLPTEFPFNLTQVQILFSATSGVNVGDAIDLAIFQDADGDPLNGAEWLASYSVTAQVVDGVTWSIYDLPSPLLVSGPGDVLIGAINRYTVSGVTAPTFPAALDQSASQGRSWVAAWATTDPPVPPLLPADGLYGVVDDFGFPGNWLLRGVGETLTGIPWLSENPISGTVEPGEFVVVEVTFDSTGMAPGDYQGTLDVLSNDPDIPDVPVPVSMTVLAQADLGITKTGDPEPAVVGQDLTYTLLVTNYGPDPATGVMVQDILPTSVTFVSAPGCTEAAGMVTCDVGDLAVDGVVEITIVVVPTAEGVITNLATVAAVEVDPFMDNNFASLDTTVVEKFHIYLPIIFKE